MGGTAAGAAKRKRCTCGQFEHPGKPHGKPGQAPYRTPEERRATDLAYLNRWREANPEAWKAIGKRYRDSLRMKVMRHYSGMDEPACACCGVVGIVFLTLDHIDGGGAEERRTGRHRGGTAQYARLKRDGFPPGYQVLCWNCNSAKHQLGLCPHQLIAEASKPSRS